MGKRVVAVVVLVVQVLLLVIPLLLGLVVVVLLVLLVVVDVWLHSCLGFELGTREEEKKEGVEHIIAAGNGAESSSIITMLQLIWLFNCCGVCLACFWL